MRLSRLAATVAVVGWLCAAGAEAASVAKLGDGEGGEFSITLSEEDGRDGTTATLTCAPDARRHGVVLVLGSGSRAMSREPTDIDVTIDGVPLGAMRFDGVQEMLMLLSDGDANRALVARLAKARSFTLSYGARIVTFVPGDHPAEIGRYLESCRM